MCSEWFLLDQSRIDRKDLIWVCWDSFNMYQVFKISVDVKLLVSIITAA